MTIPSNSSIDFSTGQDTSVPIREIALPTNSTALADQPSLIGLVEIHTGVRDTKMKYCTNSEVVQNNASKYISTSISLYTLMKMVNKWKTYDDTID